MRTRLLVSAGILAAIALPSGPSARPVRPAAPGSDPMAPSETRPLRVNWGQTGKPIATGVAAESPLAVSDDAGGAFVFWSSADTGGLYAEKLDAEGVERWGGNGVLVGTVRGGADERPAAVSDGAGGAIVVWPVLAGTDAGLVRFNIQRIGADGALLWDGAAPAVPPQAGEAQVHPVMIGDQSGGGAIVWSGIGADASVLRAQRFDSSGLPLWGPNGATLARAAGDGSKGERRSSHPFRYSVAFGSATTTGSRTLLVVWTDDTGRTFAQKVKEDGALAWNEEGTLLDGDRRAAAGGTPLIVTDGSGGAHIAWRAENGAGGTPVRAQRLDEAGTPRWDGGRTLDSGLRPDRLRLLPDGAGGALFLWEESVAPDGGRSELLAQRLDAEGTWLWPLRGALLTAMGGSARVLDTSVSESGGIGVLWSEPREDAGLVFRVQRITGAGKLVWRADGTRAWGIAPVAHGRGGVSGRTASHGASLPGAAPIPDRGQVPPISVSAARSGDGGWIVAATDEMSSAQAAVTVQRLAPALGSVEHHVAVRSFEFDPVSVYAATGDTITWNFEDGPHTTTSGSCVESVCTPDGKWNSSVQSSGSYSVVFNQEGYYEYHCAVHGAMMLGTVYAFGQPIPLGCDAVASPPDGVTSLLVNFTPKVLGLGPFSADWDFGDGTTSTEFKPAHTYTAPGSYVATVNVHVPPDSSCLAQVEVLATPRCTGRTISRIKIVERRRGAKANVILFGTGFDRTDILEINNGLGFVPVPTRRPTKKRMVALNVEPWFPDSSTVRLRVANTALSCSSDSVPASR